MKVLRILVPLDETAMSLKALDTVRHLALTVDSCLVELLHAVSAEETPSANAEEFLAGEAAKLSGPRIEVSYHVAIGDPAEVILNRVRETHFDFVCMTTRAVPSEADQPGSVAARIFERCPIPIIALPANQAGTPEAENHAARAFFRAAVYLPAEMEFEEIKHPVKVIVRDLSAKGAEVEAPGGEVLRAASCMLTLMLPTRSQPLEIFTSIVDMEHATGDSGQEVQLLHTTFPTIRMGDQDAIVAFLNNLRTLERQQRRLKVPVDIEVITGERAYAHFKGYTRAVRPDYMWLHMERFDRIEGADVTLRVRAAESAETFALDGTVTNVNATGGDQFDVEVELAAAPVGSAQEADSGDELMRFLRLHYAESADEVVPPDAPVLVPRRVRPPRPRLRMARVVTAPIHEISVPIRAPKSAPGVPLKRQARDAEERALVGILAARRKSGPLRSI